MKTIITRNLVALLAILFAGTLSAQTYSNNFQDINFGGSGVTITNYPSGSSGDDEGDVILYEGVATYSGTEIDCYVVVEDISSGTTITEVDQNSTSGPGYNFNEQRFFAPFTVFPSGSSSGPGGDVTFSIHFIADGSFAYNSGSPTGTIVTLSDVRINAYDIDGSGGSYSNQAVEFGGFDYSEFANPTNLASTYDATTGLTSFRSTTHSNTTNANDDRNRVRVTYDSLSSIEVKISGGSTSYSFLDFGGGWSWSNAPDEYYQLMGNIYNDADAMQDSYIDGPMISQAGSTDLYVNLINSGDSVVESLAVNSNGTYVFPAVEPGTYNVLLSTTTLAVNSTGNSSSLPGGWVNTAEVFGTGSTHDGVIDGILSGLTIDSNSLTNANIGIEALPVATVVNTSVTKPNFGVYLVLGTSGSSELAATDNEDGTLGAGDKFAITSLPTNGNELYYNSVLVTLGDDGTTAPSMSNPYTIDNYVPANLSIRFVGTGTSVTMDYIAYDDADLASASAATYTLNWVGNLPVEFISVSAENMGGNQVMIEWSTASELNNEYFVVERRMENEEEFTAIGTVAGAGNSSDILTYSFMDMSIYWMSNTAYYRIKQVDFDGQSEFSEVAVVENTEKLSFEIYPNPATDFIKVSANDNYSITKVSVINSAGQVLKSAEGYGVISIAVSDLEAGIYFVQYELDGQFETSRFIKRN
ncbi:MAG: T9SS type A sorting domain-containing protein [Bacteroidia bacterium]